MNEKQPSWDDLSLFLTVARAGGLSAASRVTGQSAATIGRHMLALERILGHELFIRHPNGYRLTPKAEELEKKLLNISRELDDFYDSLKTDAKPVIKISAGSWTLRRLIRNLDMFADALNDYNWQFYASKSNLSVIRREISIGIRNRKPDERGLAGLKIGTVEFAVYAAQDAPDRWIGTFSETPSQAWLKNQDINIDFQVTSSRSALDLAQASAGKILLPTFVGDEEPSLQRLSGSIPELTHERWIVMHDDDRHLPQIRFAIDRIAAFFRDEG